MGKERAASTRLRLAGKTCAICGCGLPVDPRHGWGERRCQKCALPLPRNYEVLMNFGASRVHKGGFSIGFILPDARTPVGKRYELKSLERLQALVMRTRPQLGTLEELNNTVRRWGQGTVSLFLTEIEFRDLAAGKRRDQSK